MTLSFIAIGTIPVGAAVGAAIGAVLCALLRRNHANRATWKGLLPLSILALAGCGTGFFWHEIDLTWNAATGQKTIASGGVAISGEIIEREDVSRMRLHQADNNGVIRIEHRSTSGIWIWEERPSQLHFNLYIPDVSTNGYFCFAFRDRMKGIAPVRVTYEDFDTWHKGNRPLPPISAQVMPSARGGYHVRMNLAIETFRAGVTGEFVPRQPYTGK